MRSIKSIWAAKIGYILLSGLFCLLGALTLSAGEFSDRMGDLAGALLIGFGIVRLAGYFSKDLYRLAFQHDLALGVLLIALGAMALTGRIGSPPCLVLGVAILADGLFKLQTAFDAKRFGLKSWGLILALGAGAGALGGVTAFWPGRNVQSPAGLLGAALLAEGALNLCTALFAVKIVRNQRAEIRERESKEDF